MRGFSRTVIAVLLVFVLGLFPCTAFAGQKVIADVGQDFNLSQGMPSEIELISTKKTVIGDEIVIPQRSVVKLEVLQIQNERRWHKSGFVVCKLKSFETEYDHKITDISDKNIYFVARKYEPLNKKDASITATEIVLTQAASFFAPGVDILYYFTKGAIQREKHPNWFKAGVRNAYDNSVFWFWLKGKPIDMKAKDQVYVKDVNEVRADELKGQIEIRKDKQSCKDEKEEVKIDYLEQKELIKDKYNEQKSLLKNKELPKDELTTQKMQLKNNYKTQKQRLKTNKKEMLTKITDKHKEHKKHFKEIKKEIKVRKKLAKQSQKSAKKSEKSKNL